MLSKVQDVFCTHSLNLILLNVKDRFPASDMVCCVYARHRMNNLIDTSLHSRVRKCHNAYRIISFWRFTILIRFINSKASQPLIVLLILHLYACLDFNRLKYIAIHKVIFSKIAIKEHYVINVYCIWTWILIDLPTNPWLGINEYNQKDECFVTYRSGEDLVSLTPTNSSELPSSSSAVERFSILRLPHLRGVALIDLTNLFEFSSRDCSSFSQEISAMAKIRIENTIV